MQPVTREKGGILVPRKPAEIKVIRCYEPDKERIKNALKIILGIVQKFEAEKAMQSKNKEC
jgi:hypothetical protein